MAASSVQVDPGAQQSAPRLAFRDRALALAVAGLCALVLLVAAAVPPSPDGMGTHRMLGLPACSWPAAVGVPCPSCGMTTAFAHAARGNLPAALAAQPAGGVLALLTAMTFLVALHAAATGSRAVTLLQGVAGTRAAIAAAVLLLGAWGYKILVFKGVLA